MNQVVGTERVAMVVLVKLETKVKVKVKVKVKAEVKAEVVTSATQA